MTDLETVAAELEAEAQANAWPRNHREINITTAEGNAAMALVTVTLNHPGITENPDFANTLQDVAIDVAVLLNDVNLSTGDHTGLIVGSVVSPTALGGTAVINTTEVDIGGTLWPANTTIRYTPPAGVHSTDDTFSYTAALA